MRFSKDTAKNLLRCLCEMSMAQETVVLYLFCYAHDKEAPSINEIAKETGLNTKTVRKHFEMLEGHNAVCRGKPEGRKRRRLIEVKPVPSHTLPSTMSHLLTILDIPSQKSNARRMLRERVYSTSNKEEDGRKKRVGSESDAEAYLQGLEGLKQAARRAVKMAVKKGDIERPKMCSVCSKPGVPDSHHFNGYEEEHWFDIVWLCRSCHYFAEKKIRGRAGTFGLYDILTDSDWQKIKSILSKLFKGWEINPTALTKSKRFEMLIGLFTEEGFDFEAYCKWYAREKYGDKGFNFGLFLYPAMIEEFRDADEREGKYLKTSSRLEDSDSFKKGLKETEEFLKTLQDEES